MFSAFVDLAVKCSLVFTVAAILAALLRRRSAAARHIVWTGAFVSVLALPILSIGLPALHVPVSDILPLPDTGLLFQASATAGHSPDPQAVPASSGTIAASPVAGSVNWRLLLIGVWIAGILAICGRTAYAYLAVGRIRAKAKVFPDTDFVVELSRVAGVDRNVQVLEAPRGSMPMTAGVIRPAILIPTDSAEWTQEKRRVVLLHELAHVRRSDVATQLLARLALSLHWCNPLAWFAWKQFLKERERAADDLVLNAGARASDYAGHLLEIARSMQRLPAPAWAALAMARRAQLEGRLLAILDSGVERGHPKKAVVIAAMLFAVALVTPLAVLRGQTKPPQPPPDIESVFREAAARKNHQAFDDAAAAFEAIRKFDEAQKLREASLSLRAQINGERSAAYAAGLVKLGELARVRGNSREAAAFFKKAVDLGDRPEVAPALLYLAITAIPNSPDTALDYLHRARNLGIAGNLLGEVRTWMGLIWQGRESGRTEAESLYRSALAIEEEGSPQSALTMELLARLLNEQPEEKRPLDEISSLVARAAAIRKAQVGSMALKAPESTNAERIGRGMKAPSPQFKPEPQYSDEARALKVTGTVVVTVVIGVDGKTSDIRLLRGLGFGLDEQAALAVSKWQFSPGMRDGVTVPVAATIEVNFRLM